MVLSYVNCVTDVDEFARALSPNFIAVRCNFCWKPSLSGAKLKRCSACCFVHYCSEECQSNAWREHRKECERLKGKLEKWQKWPSKYRLTDDSEEGRFRMSALLFFRLLLKRDSGQLAAASGNYSGIKFADLIVREEKLTGIGDARLKRCKYHEIADAQRCASFLYGKEIDDATALDFCTKIMVSGFPITDGESAMGCSMYLDIAERGSCRPNAIFMVVEETKRMRIIPLPDADGKPLFDAHNVAEIHPGNAELIATKGVRRGRVERAFFRVCECERCADPTDDFLSAIVCEKCSASVSIDDAPFRHWPSPKFSEKVPLSPPVLERIQRTLSQNADDESVVRKMLVLPEMKETCQIPDHFECEYFGPALKNLQVVCSACGTTQSSEHVEFAFAMMTVVDRVRMTHAPEALATLHHVDVESAKILPDCNVYRAKFHRLMADDPHADPSMRADRLLKWHAVLKKCIPRGHFDLLPDLHALCEALIAVPSKSDQLRAVVADYLQVLKVAFCARLRSTDSHSIPREFLRTLDSSLGVASDETAYWTALTKVNERNLLKIAHRLVERPA